jgi:hypothetical protein
VVTWEDPVAGSSQPLPAPRDGSASVALYDVCADGSAVAGDLKGGAVGLVLGLLLLAVVRKRKDAGPRLLALCFLLVWIGVSIANAISDHRAHRAACDALTTGRVLVAEGEVSDFSALPPDGRGWETFRVGEAFFRIAPGRGAGLKRVSVNGGPIREGRRVRVTYAGEEILKVEELGR